MDELLPYLAPHLASDDSYVAKKAADVRRIFLGDIEGRLWAIDAEDGRPVTGFGAAGHIAMREGMATGFPKAQYGLTSPVATGGRRFVVGSMGSPFLSGYQMGDSPSDTPQLLWRLRTAGVMYESLPAISGNLGFFLCSDGWLRAVR